MAITFTVAMLHRITEVGEEAKRSVAATKVVLDHKALPWQSARGEGKAVQPRQTVQGTVSEGRYNTLNRDRRETERGVA